MEGKSVRQSSSPARSRLPHLRPGTADIALGVIVFHLITPPFALAYLDPISGSIILQILAAGFLAAAATFRRSRQWFSDLLNRLSRKVQ